MLAHTFDPKKHDIRGWLASEKLDGNRCFWDGGVSRGVPKTEVPWANNDRDERYVDPPIATGLWTRYGNIFHAPESFLDSLPPFPLDGELYTERKSWQKLAKVIKKITPEEEAWAKVRYHIFDIPEYAEVFANGQSNDIHFTKTFNLQDNMVFLRSKRGYSPRYRDLQFNYDRMQKTAEEYPILTVVEQTKIRSVDEASALLDTINEAGGEGIIMRSPKSYWEPRRSKMMLKWKPYLDAEAIVIGYTWGRQTDKGSKHLGRMGALITHFRGQRLELSGFSDDERKMRLVENPKTINGHTEPFDYPGHDASLDWYNPLFPRGAKVTFRYRELSDTNIPKEARYLRPFMGI